MQLLRHYVTIHKIYCTYPSKQEQKLVPTVLERSPVLDIRFIKGRE